MKRNQNRKSSTPAQKTTLLNFFQRTPLSVTHKVVASSSSSTAEISSVSSRHKRLPDSSSSLAIPKKIVFDATSTECPGCSKSVPLYRLNDHLDQECAVLGIQLPPKRQISHAHPPVAQTSLTPVKKELFERNPKMKSETKMNEARRRDIAASVSVNLPVRKVQTDLKQVHPIQHETKGARKKLFVDMDSSVEPKPKYAVPYYLESFLFFLKATFDEPLNHHLLIHEDHETCNTFLSLSPAAQQLFVRLFSRKFQWRRREKIVYPDISPDLDPALAELCDSGFLLGAEQLQDLQELFRLLSQPEIKNLFKEAKLPFNGKANALEIFTKHCQSQPSALQGQHSKSMADRMVVKIKRQYIQACYKLNEKIRQILLRCIMLSTLHQRPEEEEDKGQLQQQSFNMLQVTVGQKSYPQFKIRREKPIFQNREHFLAYGEAIMLELKVREAVERKEWESVIEQTSGIRVEESQQQQDREMPLFLRRFTAGAVRLHMLDKRVEALQTLKRHQEAVELLEQLIGQDCYLLSHRGYWYERLALNLEQHLKDPRKALDVIKNGLNDDWVTPAHRLALSVRATRLCQSPKMKMESFLKELPLLVPSEPPCITIIGRSLPSQSTGRKSTFIRGDSRVNVEDGDVTLCSVEELVLQHYVENGYSQGIHGEGSTIWTLVGLLFWDVLYHSDVPDVFLSPFQAAPLDLDSLDFFRSRSAAIEGRLKTVSGWSSEDLIDWIGCVWKENYGRTSIVSWERFRDWDHVNGLLSCIAPQVLAGISERLLRNFRHYRSGFPDLVVWNPDAKKWRVVEVKGPNDRLSPKQTLWLDFLVSLGVEAEVCHVQAVGTKRMGATPHAPVSNKKTNKSNQTEALPDHEIATKSIRHTRSSTRKCESKVENKTAKLIMDVDDSDFEME